MECTTVRDLCSFFAGDTLEYDFTFKDSDGSSVDVRGMTLTFTMKINKDDRDGGDSGLQESVTFPLDSGSENGEGGIHIPATSTAKLLVERWYQFDFNLTSGSNKYTLGTGRIFVKQKVKTS